ncbi:helix-turn-helix domain-containing protein [Kibdelosporangium philippinense]|uniref:Helix-turn-helix domain-containing protein n=1 Tax=Kibdelosporangium philippinense TaxID=211113 RepID=A0ABS8ZJR7_9PSEU|nr:helix-turn-helix domain-containing protein [Kibdelosporangium philippinense]MCE7008016.1 helix-turn-helix domain-containing protein [Kibdelosporangium philippinense]
MPRLTLEDRRFIADGMADGLGYAEIARRLNRPTSTISREVARNIGSHGYQPDQAEDRTRQRGRRPKQHKQVARERTEHQFEGKLVAVLIEKGFPRMPARALACLYVAESDSLTAAELVRRLKVSPASVSAAVQYLSGIGMIRREHDGRRDRYVADNDAWFRSMMASAQTMVSWGQVASEGAILFGDTSAGARMATMAKFIDHVTEDMLAAFDRWRHLLYS